MHAARGVRLTDEGQNVPPKFDSELMVREDDVLQMRVSLDDNICNTPEGMNHNDRDLLRTKNRAG